MELLDFRKIWLMLNAEGSTAASIARELDIGYQRLLKISRMLEEYYFEDVLEDWLKVTERLLSIQNERGRDHREDNVMMQMRVVFSEFVRDPINVEEVPSNEDIDEIYEVIVGDPEGPLFDGTDGPNQPISSSF